MQAAKNAKETAANAVASAKCAVVKTKATVDAKMEMGKARDPAQKEAVTRKKEERIIQADRQEQQARACNAAAKQSGKAGTGGPTGVHPTGTHPTSALPGHGTGGHPTGTHPSSALPGQRTGGHPTGTHPSSALAGQGTGGYPTGTHPTSALPGQGTGGVGSHPIGTDKAGTGRPNVNNRRDQGYGS
ncbi:11 kDa late embryogenesis abundant protein-like [Alnus glutinosa]|uniref:11 kDa late embryogenesis abundant protein-like n=1 Tax=Alnus glutinosa TaxID=3517 RepID=UPI002D77870D|nr:11 kDa late embryogenesis abundant protein-like [Alnus glutinosa]